MDCIFCKIITGQIASEIVYQDHEFVAFRDINPQAPVHILVVPRQHIESIAHVKSEQADLIGRMFLFAVKVAEKAGVSDSGYRLAINYGEDAHLVVPHLHLHLVGGRKLNDMLG